MGAPQVAAQSSSAALLPLINQGVAPANAVVLEQGLRAALANAERGFQAGDRTTAIVEGARASGMSCDVEVKACALQMGALANVSTAYVARVLPHDDRGFWVELVRYDVANQTELQVRRSAVTLDEPHLSDGIKAIVDGTIAGTDVEADLRGPARRFPLDTALYIGGGAAVGVGFLAAVASGVLVAMTYGVSQEKVTSIEEPAENVGTVRLLSTTAVLVGASAAVAVAAGFGAIAAGTAVTVGQLDE